MGKEAGKQVQAIDVAKVRLRAIMGLHEILGASSEQPGRPRFGNPLRDALIHKYTELRVRTFLESGIDDSAKRAELELYALMEARRAADGSYAHALDRVTGIIDDLVSTSPDEDAHARQNAALTSIRITAEKLSPNLELGTEADKLVSQLDTH